MKKTNFRVFFRIFGNDKKYTKDITTFSPEKASLEVRKELKGKRVIIDKIKVIKEEMI